MGQTYNIIIMCCSPPDIPDDQKCEMQIEALKVFLNKFRYFHDHSLN